MNIYKINCFQVNPVILSKLLYRYLFLAKTTGAFSAARMLS